MVARFTPLEDAAIIQSWINVFVAEGETRNIVSGVNLWEIVVLHLTVRNGNPHQRTSRVLQNRVPNMKRKVKLYLSFLVPLLRNMPSGWTMSECRLPKEYDPDILCREEGQDDDED
ncbi:hypothetical protein MKW92_029056 [Papaver armeniacum]|nr:hypothetical protein MKW92_029056 [Papaver armeniacum]